MRCVTGFLKECSHSAMCDWILKACSHSVMCDWIFKGVFTQYDVRLDF